MFVKVTLRHYSNKGINKKPIMKIHVEAYWIYRLLLFKKLWQQIKNHFLLIATG
jgi:hypothetical protein